MLVTALFTAGVYTYFRVKWQSLVENMSAPLATPIDNAVEEAKAKP
jgi:hypothetical protein